MVSIYHIAAVFGPRCRSVLLMALAFGYVSSFATMSLAPEQFCGIMAPCNDGNMHHSVSHIHEAHRHGVANHETSHCATRHIDAQDAIVHDDEASCCDPGCLECLACFTGPVFDFPSYSDINAPFLTEHIPASEERPLFNPSPPYPQPPRA